MSHGETKWVERDSFLRIIALSPLMISRMAVRVRQYTAQGRLIRIEETFDVTSSSTKQSFFVPLVEGWIESISVGDSNFKVQRGRVFVQLAIQADEDSQALPHTILAADYFVSSVGLQWPGTPIRPYRDGPGYLTSSSIGAPAAGNDFSYTIETAVVKKIMSVAFRLATDANVANRRSILEIVTGGILAYSLPMFNTQSASSTFDHFFMPVGSHFTSAVSGVFQTFLPQNLFLKAGDIIRSRIDLIQAGDQISNIVVVFEEWAEERS